MEEVALLLEGTVFIQQRSNGTDFGDFFPQQIDYEVEISSCGAVGIFVAALTERQIRVSMIGLEKPLEVPLILLEPNLTVEELERFHYPPIPFPGYPGIPRD